MMHDPFDIIWVDEDPLGREIILLQTVVDAREKAGKHEGAEYLSHEEIRSVVTNPSRIDLTQRSPKHREIYYKEDDGHEFRYSRVVVNFDDDRGWPISWSRYKEHVSFIETVYEKTDEGE